MECIEQGTQDSRILRGVFGRSGWKNMLWSSSWPNQALPPETCSPSSFILEVALQKASMSPGMCGGVMLWVSSLAGTLIKLLIGPG